MLAGVVLARLSRMLRGMCFVSGRGMRVMSSFLVRACFVVFGRLVVMACSVRVMLRCFAVMFRGFL